MYISITYPELGFIVYWIMAYIGYTFSGSSIGKTCMIFTLFNKNHESLANKISRESISNISHDPIYNETKFWIGDGYIHTTVESVDLGISYWGFPLDDEGYPLVHKNHAEAV